MTASISMNQETLVEGLDELACKQCRCISCLFTISAATILELEFSFYSRAGKQILYN
jgi:hypothetical protein